jgi:hypothetical protein
LRSVAAGFSFDAKRFAESLEFFKLVVPRER